MRKKMIEFLMNYLTGSPKHLLQQCIDEAEDNHVQVAYVAAQNRACRHKVIYLLGGNNPDTCPF